MKKGIDAKASKTKSNSSNLGSQASPTTSKPSSLSKGGVKSSTTLKADAQDASTPVAPKKAVDYSEALDLPEPTVEQVEDEIAKLLQQELDEKSKPSVDLTLDLILECHAVSEATVLRAAPAELRVSFFSCLTHLRLDRLRLASLPADALASLPAVTHVYLQHNRLVGTGPLAALSSLKFLTVAYNQLQQVEGLSGLHNLLFLDVTYNQLNGLQHPQLPASLRFLKIEGNPFLEGRELQERERLLAKMPHLHDLDGPVDEEPDSPRADLTNGKAATLGTSGQALGSEDEDVEDMGVGPLQTEEGAAGSWWTSETALGMLEDTERSCMRSSVAAVRSSVRASVERASSAKAVRPSSATSAATASSISRGGSGTQPAARAASPARAPSPGAQLSGRQPLPRSGSAKHETPLVTAAFKDAASAGSPSSSSGGAPGVPPLGRSGSGGADAAKLSRPPSGGSSLRPASGGGGSSSSPAGLRSQALPGAGSGQSFEQQVEADLLGLQQRLRAMLEPGFMMAGMRSTTPSGSSAPVPAEQLVGKQVAALHAELDRMLGAAAARVRKQRQVDESISETIRSLRTSGGALGDLKKRMAQQLKTAPEAGGEATAALRASLILSAHGAGAGGSAARASVTGDASSQQLDAMQLLRSSLSKLRDIKGDGRGPGSSRPTSARGAGAGAGELRPPPSKSLFNNLDSASVAEAPGEEGRWEEIPSADRPSSRPSSGNAAGSSAPRQGSGGGSRLGTRSTGPGEGEESLGYEDEADVDESVDVSGLLGGAFKSSLPPNPFAR